MAALVEILFHKGAIITGSDVSERFYTDEILEKLGLKALPFSSENITSDIQYVVYSSAYKLDKNPDLIEAVKQNIPCLLYTEALGSYSSRAYSCGVCGVHGKTSTTGLVGTILKEIDLPTQTLVGSIINSFGGTCTYTSPLVSQKKDGEKSIFVAETCEYQRHFMSFCPQKIILTSVEPDHQDYYPTYEDIREAFVDYICKLPEGGDLIYCADDKGACDTVQIAIKKRPDINLIPYGETAEGDYKLTFGKVINEKNNFTLDGLKRVECKKMGDAFAQVLENTKLYLRMPGRHEVMDAAGAVALVCQILKSFGKDPLAYQEQIAKGLANFSGGKLRSEIVGRMTVKASAGDSLNTSEKNDVIVIDDYGHHPTAVKTTLEGFREFYKGRKIIVDFMSHTYSRTQALLKEFAASFDCVDVVILHKIYSSARENAADFNITGKTLYDEVRNHISEKKASSSDKTALTVLKEDSVYYFEEILDAADFAKAEIAKPLPEEYKDGYLFVTMGAGDNWKLGKEILK